MKKSIRLLGFTLLEVILYVAITSILLTFTTLFVVQIGMQIGSVDVEARQQIEVTIAMTRAIRELERATTIDRVASQFGVNPSKIVFRNPTTGANDTLEAILATGVLQIRRANGSIEPLTTADTPLTEFRADIKNLQKRSGTLYLRIHASGINIPFETAITLRTFITL